jgi:WD40 repeat protein
MAWNAHILASGSRDRLIFQRDVRCAEPYLRKLIGHKQEVCGLRWSFDDQQLASGGNDNKVTARLAAHFSYGLLTSRFVAATVVHLECARKCTVDQIQRPHSCSEGHRLVTSSARYMDSFPVRHFLRD